MKKLLTFFIVASILIFPFVKRGNSTETIELANSQAVNIGYCDINGIEDKLYKNHIVTQNISVFHNGVQLRPSIDYAITYLNNDKPGIATVTVIGLGNFLGEIDKTFNIYESKCKNISLQNPSPDTVSISFDAVPLIKGYEVEYALNKKFRQKEKATSQTNSFTLTKLKKDTRYYFRIRAIESEEQKAFGDWSKTRSIKTAKDPKDRKVCYLTFDDGPSKNTIKILKILKEKKITATFFVTAQSGENKDILKKIHKQGSTIGIHSYSHDYSKIYKNTKSYFKDFNKIRKVIKSATGENTKIFRFPGGSNNTISKKYNKGIMKTLIKETKKRGYVYFDWNCDSMDASGSKVSAKTIIKSVKTWSQDRKTLVILMHDSLSKKETVKALPYIIRYLKKQGYEFESITPESKPVQF